MTVAKKKPTPDEVDGGSEPFDYATVRYKAWVRAELERRGWGYDDLWREMRQRTPFRKTKPAINTFLGAQDRPPTPSNTRFMAHINKVLGLGPPPRCEPDNEIQQLQAKIAERWWKMTPRERAAILELLADEP